MISRPTRLLTAALLTAGLLFAAVGCSSKSDPKKPFDEQLKSNTTDSKEKVGLKNDKVVIQKRVYLEEQMWKYKTEVTDLENAIYGESKQYPGGMWSALKDCRKRMADPRVGGSGTAEPMEKWEKISQRDDDYEFMVDDKKHVVGVSEEDLDQRIITFKKDRRVLQTSYDDFKSKLDNCEDRYRTALVQHGLNPDDTKAKGEWVDGPNGYKVWRMKKAATTDPEEMMLRKKNREDGN